MQFIKNKEDRFYIFVASQDFEKAKKTFKKILKT